ncbi:MAG: hypothetical protein EZS28_017316 [Streblomastix strix]|uniref:Uncharacterized protein n=1 Tax=Streblomastix strix TaxID=222440 RepID=A0A5J4VX39_9EUKA|nr:MAG: hypothetical protein EZS28_017316 [Streblomastix strix]
MEVGTGSQTLLRMYSIARSPGGQDHGNEVANEWAYLFLSAFSESGGQEPHAWFMHSVLMLQLVNNRNYDDFPTAAHVMTPFLLFYTSIVQCRFDYDKQKQLAVLTVLLRVNKHSSLHAI